MKTELKVVERKSIYSRGGTARLLGRKQEFEVSWTTEGTRRLKEERSWFRSLEIMSGVPGGTSFLAMREQVKLNG